VELHRSDPQGRLRISKIADNDIATQQTESDAYVYSLFTLDGDFAMSMRVDPIALPFQTSSSMGWNEFRFRMNNWRGFMVVAFAGTDRFGFEAFGVNGLCGSPSMFRPCLPPWSGDAEDWINGHCLGRFWERSDGLCD